MFPRCVQIRVLRVLHGRVAEGGFSFFSLAAKCLCVSMLRHIVGSQLAKKENTAFQRKTIEDNCMYIIFTCISTSAPIEILSCWAAEKSPRLCFEPLPLCSTEMEL